MACPENQPGKSTLTHKDDYPIISPFGLPQGKAVNLDMEAEQ